MRRDDFRNRTTIRIAKRFRGRGCAPDDFAPPIRCTTSSWVWNGIMREANRRGTSEKNIIREALVEYLERRGIESPEKSRPTITVSPPPSAWKLAKACATFIHTLSGGE